MSNDTILAIATAPGAAGVGVIRVSGPLAVDVVAPFFVAGDGKALGAQAPRYLAFGKLVDGDGTLLDEAMVVRFAAPHSFTGEEVVEIQAHGGTFHLRRLVELLLQRGQGLPGLVRLARAGEFTQRAFIAGKIDLTRAEAVADLIQAGSELTREAAARQLAGGLQALVEGLRQDVLGLLAEAEAACDFPEEEDQLAPRQAWARRSADVSARMQGLLDTADTGRMLTQGVRVAIAGAPNAGKSSLLNALAGEERAIVSPEPGTTRDWLELRYQVQGFPIVLFDTAGLRESRSAVEAEGVRRARQLAADADLLLLVLDQSAPFDAGQLQLLSTVSRDVLLVLNKNDLSPVWDITSLRTALRTLRPEWLQPEALSKRVLSVSALNGAGLGALQARMLDVALAGRAAQVLEQVLLTQSRHERAMRASHEAMQRVIESIAAGASAEFVAVDLRTALDSLGEIVGATARAEVVDEIFRRFCIGK